MNTEQQDKRWNSLTDEVREKIQEDYKGWQETTKYPDDFKARALRLFENEYGIHNLNPKQIDF